MPYVTISTVRGIFDVAQKQALLERVTDLMVEIEGQVTRTSAATSGSRSRRVSRRAGRSAG
ncbi:tautomerase family protein [Bradyrhizobium sp. USDA 4506]